MLNHTLIRPPSCDGVRFRSQLFDCFARDDMVSFATGGYARGPAKRELLNKIGHQRRWHDFEG